MSNFLVLELGSKSLKIHRKVGDGSFEKYKVPWDAGHEVYREGRLSTGSRDLLVDIVRRLERRGFRREAMLAVATGALRDAVDREAFLAFVRERLSIEIRILSGREEASLLAQGFIDASTERPALVLDIGGGSLQTVYLAPDQTILRDSLPLGAIRLHYLGRDSRDRFDHGFVSEMIEGILREASVIQVPAACGTGGPVKALAQVLGRERMTLEDLTALEERVLREGPPPGLKPERSMIFLPGVMVMRRLLAHCGASQLRYLAIPVGRIFLGRFLDRARPELGDRSNVMLLSNLRVTGIFPAPRSEPPGPGPSRK